MCNLSGHNIKVKSVKSVEVVTFPSTGFFSKRLMGLVITRKKVVVSRIEHGECKGRATSYWPPKSCPLSCLCLEFSWRLCCCKVGPHCLGLCPAVLALLACLYPILVGFYSHLNLLVYLILFPPPALCSCPVLLCMHCLYSVWMKHLSPRNLSPLSLCIHACHNLNTLSLILGPGLCCSKACAHKAEPGTLVCVTAWVSTTCG